MGAVQIVATVLAAAVTVVAVVLAVRAVLQMTRVIRLGKPDPARFTDKGVRTKTMLVETAGHTRMLKWGVVGAAHWFVMVSFVILFLLVLEAYFEVVDPQGGLPVIGSWWIYGLVTEIIGVLGLIGILVLIVIRQRSKRSLRSRFTGSTMWQGYFVEAVIVGVLICGFLIRGFKAANHTLEFPVWATPVSHGLGALLPAAANGPTWVALVKLFISMGWLITIALNVTMGVAWHRFLAFFNIFFKRDPEKPAGSGLGPLRPMMTDGKPLDFEEADPEKDQFGVAQVEQFTFKGLLDFSTCTECGRCQSQCPAWNTGKPLSPKLVITALRDHAYAKAPYLLAGGGKDLAGEEKAPADVLGMLSAGTLAEAERPLVGTAGEGGVIDPDVLWSCTTCGACVEQCPVDIEHVDHIVDMRRYQVLIESAFPSEAGVMLRNLENKGNPWGMNASSRTEWMEGLPFEVRRASPGTRLDADIEYLFWVGCAGALEDRSRKVTVAFAELLHTAGVEFAVLGAAETCTGDPARRLGNEFLFQMQGMQNVEPLNSIERAGPMKVVATCPHCFNTLANEYPQLGGHYEVVHHTQLLGRLVADGRLVPVDPVDKDVTYHDPCYPGRHNKVYTPPREVLGAIPALKSHEMHRCKDRGFCCGAGGARFWMEEKIGKRINVERTEEALGLDPDLISTACPFCITMLSDALTAKKQNGEAAEHVESSTSARSCSAR